MFQARKVALLTLEGLACARVDENVSLTKPSRGTQGSDFDIGPARLSVTLLGGFDLRRGDERIPDSAWQHRNAARTLVKLLALAPERRLHREQLTDYLWPDSDPESSAPKLRKAIHAARHALEPGLGNRAASAYLTLLGQSIVLDKQRVVTDVDRFRERASTALSGDDEVALLRALEAYRGELLPEDRYEEWAEEPRRQLSISYRQVLLRLISLLESRGAIAQAIEHMRSVIQVDPTDEAMHQHLMRLHMRLGSRHSALLAYRECTRLLHEELGVTPSRETEAIHQQLLSGLVEPPGDADVEVIPDQLLKEGGNLVGRTQPLARARTLLQAAVQGNGSLLLIGGEAGVGKTRLAIEVAREAGAAARILWVTAFAEESLLPYSIFGGLLNAFVGALSSESRSEFATEYPELLPLLHLTTPKINPPGSQIPSPEEQARLYRATIRFLSDLALQKPVVMVIDDVHLADSASLQLLRHLGRHAERYPWLIMGTYRTEEARSSITTAGLIQAVRRDGLGDNLVLEGLTRAECTELASGVLGDGDAPAEVPRQLMERIYHWSLGNPLFVTEFLRMARSEGETILIEGEAVNLPETVQGVIEERTQRLSPECRRVLGLAAVSGMQWPFQVIKLAGAEGFDPPFTEARLVDVFDEALLAGVVEEIAVGSSWGYAFTHPLMQAVLYSSLSRHRRAHFHRVLGKTLEDVSPEEVELVAHHYLQSNEKGRAVPFLRSAADRAFRLYAHEQAAAYFEQLTDLLTADGQDPEAAKVELELGKSLYSLARYEEGFKVTTRALNRFEAAGNGMGAIAAQALLARFEGEQGDSKAGMARIQATLAAIPPHADPYVLADLYFTMAKLTFLDGRYEESLDAATKLREVAERFQGRERDYFLGEAFSCIGVVRQMLGEADVARDVLQAAIDLSESAGDLESLSRSLNNLGSLHADAGHFKLAGEYLQRALDTTRRIGDPSKIAWQLCVLANIQSLLGDWTVCEGLLLDALDMLEPVGGTWFRAYPLVQMANLYLNRGDSPGALRFMEEAMPFVDGSGDLQIVRWAQGRLAEIDLMEGRYEEAASRIRSVSDRPGLEESDVTNILPILAEALLDKDPDEAQAIAEDAIKRARGQNDVVSLVEGLRIRGTIALRQKDGKTAASVFGELLTLAARLPYPHAEAVAHLGLAETAMFFSDESGEAERELAKAEDIFARLGAGTYLSRVRSLRTSVSV